MFTIYISFCTLLSKLENVSLSYLLVRALGIAGPWSSFARTHFWRGSDILNEILTEGMRCDLYPRLQSTSTYTPHSPPSRHAKTLTPKFNIFCQTHEWNFCWCLVLSCGFYKVIQTFQVFRNLNKKSRAGRNLRKTKFWIYLIMPYSSYSRA